jgi:hypothetical protein
MPALPGAADDLLLQGDAAVAIYLSGGGGGGPPGPPGPPGPCP